MISVEKITTSMITGGIAAFVFGCLWLVAPRVDVWLFPTSSFFEVRSIQVFGAFRGDDPVMLVDSAVKGEFPGEFSVKIHDANGVAVEDCFVREQWPYTPRDSRITVNLFSWWMLNKAPNCRLRSGREYQVITVWKIKPKWHSERMIINRTNYFPVWRREEQQKHD